MAKIKLLAGLSLIFLLVLSAEAQRKYVVYFKDKANTSIDLNAPLSIISQRSLDRRNMDGISLDSTDLPVNSNYISQVELTGADVIRSSKWLNAVVVDCDSATLQQVLNLSFVKSNSRILKVQRTKRDFPEEPIDLIRLSNAKTLGLNYGAADSQIRMLGADKMHDDGFNGDGVWVGVFDSGFRNVDTISEFDDLRNSGRLIGTYDIVDGDNTVFNAHSHGTSVLSLMASYSPGNIIGTGYGASYLLFRTEDVSSETQLEEFNWLVAAEMADSMGVDIINTSLGYSSLDDFSHTYSEMDGRTTIISRAALMASRKGILCVTSAGNEGSSQWFYITAPADADSILTIGAVQSDSLIAGFSSRGPTFDGRIKPDLVAQGRLSAVVNANTGNVVNGSGTSYSAPLVSGLMAGMMQALPDLSNIELIELMRESADNFASPDNNYGYGIPNYENAILLSSLQKELVKGMNFILFPNPLTSDNHLNLIVGNRMVNRNLEMEFFNSAGSKIASHSLTPRQRINKVPINEAMFNAKNVIVRISSDLGNESFQLTFK